MPRFKTLYMCFVADKTTTVYCGLWPNKQTYMLLNFELSDSYKTQSERMFESFIIGVAFLLSDYGKLLEGSRGGKEVRQCRVKCL